MTPKRMGDRFEVDQRNGAAAVDHQLLSSNDITVAVRGDGSVTVNGHLVAEVAVGVVDGRDRLNAELRLHRMAAHVRDALRYATDMCGSELALPVETDNWTKRPERRWEPLEFAEGLVDGIIARGIFVGVPRKHSQEFRAGFRCGERLAAMLAALDREATSG